MGFSGSRMERLLIANRGEIARRIIRSAREMGIFTIATYADSDSTAPYVTEADLAVRLPGNSAAETYLNQEAILAAAKAASADSVHPGYGFLSENAAFASTVIAAGLVWVGPPPDAIALLGNKVRAKKLMESAGVPTLPTWRPGAADIRYPLLVKAEAGGGGRGMRIVTDESFLAESIASASREAETSFGDPAVFLERFIPAGRHVEIQVLADSFGDAIHLFERDCSIQRRHQKVIEEAPSPAVDAALRQKMGEAALTAVAAAGYQNAGTIEFILEPSGEFWFLEANTRLQVEHPVTEAICGVDLVREQLLIASGEHLSLRQEDLSISGYAIEARLYAEDPSAGFIPTSGHLVAWHPATYPELRWESGVGPGSVVGTEFDSMLAKVIACAPTRSEAAAKLALGLARSTIQGLRTNRDFLISTLRNPTFLAGTATTAFIDSGEAKLAREISGIEFERFAVAAALQMQQESRKRSTLPSLPSGWRNSVMPPQEVSFRHAANEITIRYVQQRDGSFKVNGNRALIHSVSGQWIDLEYAGIRERFHLVLDGDTVWIQGAYGDVELELLPRFPAAGAGAAPQNGLFSPLPGRIVSTHVTPGDRVAPGDLLVVVEAMKMEHQISAQSGGIVEELLVQVGDQVAAGEAVARLEVEK